MFAEEERGVLHILEKFNNYLPPYMRARSGLWSLTTRRDWVWVVADHSAGLAVGTKDPSLRKEKARGSSSNSRSKAANGDPVSR